MSQSNLAEDYYDIIIVFETLLQLNEGIKVKFSEKGVKRYEQWKNKDSLVLGVAGNANKGKTYLLSLLQKEKLLDGFNKTTKGLSVKYPISQREDITILDVAGFETPWLTTKDFKYENIINAAETDAVFSNISKDRFLTEYVLQSFVLKYANIVFVVVGLLEYQDQIVINQIKNQCKKTTIIVVHNLINFFEKKQVENYVETVLMASATFKLTEKKYLNMNMTSHQQRTNVNNKYYIETINSKESDNSIIHLIMANDKEENGKKCEAGEFYNTSTINYIQNLLNTFLDIRPFQLVSLFRNHLFEVSQLIMKKPIENIKSIVYDHASKLIKINWNKENLKFNNCMVSELGVKKFFNKTFVPNYRTKIDYNQRIFQIDIEIPGEISNIHQEVLCEDDETVFTITGTKNIPKDKNNFMQYSNRDEGDFKLVIGVKKGLLIINSEDTPTVMHHLGFLTFIYQWDSHESYMEEYSNNSDEF